MILATLLLLSPALAGDLPDAPVSMSVWAYGAQLDGFIVVDADALAQAGIGLRTGETRKTGTQLPLEMGIMVITEAHGKKRFTDVIDGLMLMDGNADGMLNASDPAFAALSLFVDANGDATIAADELKTFDAIGIETITRFGDVRMKEKWTQEPVEK